MKLSITWVILKTCSSIVEMNSVGTAIHEVVEALGLEELHIGSDVEKGGDSDIEEGVEFMYKTGTRYRWWCWFRSGWG